MLKLITLIALVSTAGAFSVPVEHHRGSVAVNQSDILSVADDALPSVGIMIPTNSRPEFVTHALLQISKQAYPKKISVAIIDDSPAHLRVGELKNIDVHAEERGRGAGTVLLEEMVSVLRARGCRYCILRHLDASRPAAGFKKGGLIRWYEKHGFRLARDVLPKSLEFIDTDHMVAEVDQIYLRERAR